LGVSATGVTIIWLIVAAIGCTFLASGSYMNMVIGTLLLEFAVILDCVDGHIARFTRPTRTGDILDTWVGEILLVSSLFSIGIGLSNNPATGTMTGTIVSQFIAFDGTLFTILGFFGGLAALCSWTVRLHWRTIAQKLSLQEFEPDQQLRKSKKTLIIDNVFHYSGAFTMVLVVSAIVGFIDIALILVTVVYGAYLLMIMTRIIKKARALDRVA
jgi:phosphatidylglycerophosphate synthase